MDILLSASPRENSPIEAQENISIADKQIQQKYATPYEWICVTITVYLQRNKENIYGFVETQNRTLFLH